MPLESAASWLFGFFRHHVPWQRYPRPHLSLGRTGARKARMCRGIGLGDWLFDLDDERQLKRSAPVFLSVAEVPSVAREKVQDAHARVLKFQAESMAVLKGELKRSYNMIGDVNWVDKKCRVIDIH